MKKFKYFVYGYPADPAEPIYALYQPVMDCFLNVTESLELANKLKLLLSARYNLHICCVSGADNYQLNLIDNEVCENWTIADRNTIDLAPYPVQPENIVKVKNLQLVSRQIDWDIDQEKRWIFICTHCITFFTNLKNTFYYQLDQTLNKFLMIDKLDASHSTDTINNLENQIMKLLYLGKDFNVVEQQIIDLLRPHAKILAQWEKFVESY